MKFFLDLLRVKVSVAAVLFVASSALTLDACTGITLHAEDGSTVQARTMEWGSFDMAPELLVINRGYSYVGVTPDGPTGMKWQAKYGAVGINALGRPDYTDGMNEKGLAVSVLYLPGFAKYQPYKPEESSVSISPLQVCNWLLTTCASVAEVRQKLPDIRVVPVAEESIGGIPAPLHYLVTDSSGTTIVIEYTEGALHIYENRVGVLTNSPPFPWHITNLSNYVGLGAEAAKSIVVGDLKVNPLGAGSGMLGLPGDFTPPSRFVRATAMRNTVPTLKSGKRAVTEAFRILNNFDIPIGTMGGQHQTDLLGDTQWTSAMDTKTRRYYYRTMHNHRIRVVALDGIEFGKKELSKRPLDIKKQQDFEVVNVK